MFLPCESKASLLKQGMSTDSGSHRESTALARDKTTGPRLPRAVVKPGPSTAQQMPSCNDEENYLFNCVLTNSQQKDESLYISKIKPLVGVNDAGARTKYCLRNHLSHKTISNCKKKIYKNSIAPTVENTKNNEVKENNVIYLKELSSKEKFSKHEIENSSKKLAGNYFFLSEDPLNIENSSFSSVLSTESSDCDSAVTVVFQYDEGAPHRSGTPSPAPSRFISDVLKTPKDLDDETMNSLEPSPLSKFSDYCYLKNNVLLCNPSQKKKKNI